MTDLQTNKIKNFICYENKKFTIKKFQVCNILLAEALQKNEKEMVLALEKVA